VKPSDNRNDSGLKLQEVLKRSFDILLSGSGLILSSPAWLIAGIAITLEDGLPVFFAQSRWGKEGSHFLALKFRSMRRGSDKGRSIQAGHKDPRVTRVGRFLRACAMDELPQLWNIFVGDMSFVGPRALPIDEIQSSEDGKYIPDVAIPGFRERLSVRPGLTGIAQVFADRDTTRARKFRYDLLYIRRRSFWLDLRLIFLSFYISFLGRWEVRGNKFNKTEYRRQNAEFRRES
jgi:lipopolysaccharide/colanic/teichoic acid biosynthesis glycosyltransferase